MIINHQYLKRNKVLLNGNSFYTDIILKFVQIYLGNVIYDVELEDNNFISGKAKIIKNISPKEIEELFTDKKITFNEEKIKNIPKVDLTCFVLKILSNKKLKISILNHNIISFSIN